MPRIFFRFHLVAFSVGGLLLAVGGGIAALFPSAQYPWSVPTGIIIFGIGVVTSLLGLFGCYRASARFFDLWDSTRVYRAIGKADAKSTISVLQTSIPEPTKLIGELEKQLIDEGKQYKLRVLLINFKTAADLIAARVRLRVEKAEDHRREIQANIEQLKKMKQRVDAAWTESRGGATLKLEIRLYDFLPFGSHYQVDKDAIFVGLFWNCTSSVNGPMLQVKGSRSKLWKVFERQFEEGWKSAELLYPTPK